MAYEQIEAEQFEALLDDEDQDLEEHIEEEAPPKPVRRKKREETYDEWITKHRWGEWPMRCKVTRDGPSTYAGVPITGFLVEEDVPILERDIARRWGGGTYTVRVLGPRNIKDIESGNNNWNNGHKTIRIAGTPILDQDQAAEVAKKPSPAATAAAGELKALPAPVQRTFLDSFAEVAKASGATPEVVEAAVNRIEASAEARVEAAANAAGVQVTMLSAQLEEARRRTNELEQRMAEEKQGFEALMQKNSTASTDLISAILPAVTSNSAAQMDSILRSTESRIAQATESATQEKAAAWRWAEQQVQNMKTLFDVQLENTKASGERQLATAEATIARLQAENDRLKGDNEKLRNDILSTYQSKDPMESLNNSMQLMSMMKEYTQDLGGGGGGGDGGLALSDDAPNWMKTVAGFAPAFNDVASAVAARMNPMAGIAQNPAMMAQMQQPFDPTAAPMPRHPQLPPQPMPQHTPPQPAPQPAMPQLPQVQANPVPQLPPQPEEPAYKPLKEDVVKAVLAAKAGYENNISPANAARLVYNSDQAPRALLEILTKAPGAQMVAKLAENSVFLAELGTDIFLSPEARMVEGTPLTAGQYLAYTIDNLRVLLQPNDAPIAPGAPEVEEQEEEQAPTV